MDEIRPGQTWGAEIKKLGQKLKARASKRGPGPLLDGANEILRQLEQRANEMVPLLEIQTSEPLVQSQLPPALVQRLQGEDGTYALRVFPRLDIWRPDNLKSFLEDLRTVSPNVSGEPVLIELFERLVMRTHRLGIMFSLLAMFGLLFLVLRDIRLTMLASLPTALSLLQVLGFMGMFGWSFNPANFVAVPMLLGIGSVFGLHSVLRMKELGNDRLLCCSTGLAILLSSLTSAAGFASLGLAEHRGIASLGGLVTLGLLVNVVLSLFVLPCLVARFPHILHVRQRLATQKGTGIS